jgi:hypothetical protein
VVNSLQVLLNFRIVYSPPLGDFKGLSIEYGRSNENTLLNNEDTQSDTPISSRIVTQGDDVTILQRITGKTSLID